MNVLDSKVLEYQQKGWVVLSHTLWTAQLHKNKESAGCFLVGFLYLLSILCGVVYSATRRDTVVTLVCLGQSLRETKTGGNTWGVGSFILLALGLNTLLVVFAALVVLTTYGAVQ